jgi:aminopeptidase-like protein
VTARWRRTLDDLWRRNRVHVGADTSQAYAVLARTYPNTRLIGYPSGERCGSWTAAPAWSLRAGRLTGPDGRVVADAADHPLHVYAYSPSFRGRLSRSALDAHLMSDPARPEAIPFHFRNQYRHWAPEWGFCLPHRTRASLPDGEYEVTIDAEFGPGRLEMVEQTHAGQSGDGVLFVGHFDHPALCNDGLAGCLAGHEAITRLDRRTTRLTWRMLSTVEIVGSVFYAGREAKANGVREALVVATPGAAAPLTYQTSARGGSAIDRAMEHLMRHFAPDGCVAPFRSVFGNDEIAFDTAGVNIPCGSISRFPYPQYHTSEDTPDTVDAGRFDEVVSMLMALIDVLERNARIGPLFSGVPCLSHPSLDLYLAPPTMSGLRQQAAGLADRLVAGLGDPRLQRHAIAAQDRFFTLMNLVPALADDRTTTLDLAEQAGVPFALADAYTDLWVERGLLRKTWAPPFPS